MKEIHDEIKECLLKLSDTFQYFSNKPQTSSPHFTIDIIQKHFKVYHNHLNDLFNLKKLNLKCIFINSMFKHLLELKDIFIIIELIQNSNNEPLRREITKYNDNYQKLRFLNLKEIYSNRNETQLIYKVKKSFIVILEFVNEYEIKIKICALKEMPNYFLRDHYYYNKKSIIESKYVLMRKLSLYFEEKFKVINEDVFKEMKTKISKKKILSYFNSYYDLFNKCCYYCKKKVKYNAIEKMFCPPFYRLYTCDEGDGEFYHEECFNVVNNRAH